ncbi:CBS domain-containing protein [Kitasatospora sp. NPDC059673]|uniref:CBS domain-containing protein n=1 Tax=Kitasatospora sp. NPDC059673 TaxID=3346901 RepID=UPI0036BB24E6
MKPDTGFKEIARLLAEHDITAVPVLDHEDRPLGVVSEGNLLLNEAAQEDPAGLPLTPDPPPRERARSRATTAVGLMTGPAVCARPEWTVVEAARLIQSERVKRLPVVDEAGRLVGILSRSDLLRVFLRHDGAIREEIRAEVLRRTHLPGSGTGRRRGLRRRPTGTFAPGGRSFSRAALQAAPIGRGPSVATARAQGLDCWRKPPAGGSPPGSQPGPTVPGVGLAGRQKSQQKLSIHPPAACKTCPYMGIDLCWQALRRSPSPVPVGADGRAESGRGAPPRGLCPRPSVGGVLAGQKRFPRALRATFGSSGAGSRSPG